MKRWRIASLLFLLAALFPSGFHASERLRMSTTTSLQNCGLLDALIPQFERLKGCRVELIAVGTGKALKLAEAGDVDVVFVHDPEAERRFLALGHGVDRREVMMGDFVLVGPSGDPAGVGSSPSVMDAFRRIAEARASFISRGDDSGTHRREMALWEMTGISPEGDWYMVAGQGMGAVLLMAYEKKAYTLSDRATHLAFLDRTDLRILYSGGGELLNPYGIIAVNPKEKPWVNHGLAMDFIRYVTGPQGRSIIESFTIRGQRVFSLLP